MILRVLLTLLALLPGAGQAAEWFIDRSETEVEVSVRWIDSVVKVRFAEVEGTVSFDERRPETAAARIAVDARRPQTGLGIVDDLVRSRQFLNAAAHPSIGFTLDRLVRTSSSTADIFGSITLTGVTRPIGFKARVFRYGPSRSDPSLVEAGFDLTGEIDRTEFGITAGLPDIAAVLPVRIRLLLRNRP